MPICIYNIHTLHIQWFVGAGVWGETLACAEVMFCQVQWAGYVGAETLGLRGDDAGWEARFLGPKANVQTGHKRTDGWTDEPTDQPTNQTANDKLANRQTNNQASKKTHKQACKQASRHSQG